MTSYQRTQVYLDPEDHRRLKHLAVQREQSMTDLVREAVARYVAEETMDWVPSMDEMVAELAADPLYDGLPPGRAGLIARMRARAAAALDAGPATAPVDRALGDALHDEHAAQVAAWRRRHPSERRSPDEAP